MRRPRFNGEFYTFKVQIFKLVNPKLKRVLFMTIEEIGKSFQLFESNLERLFETVTSVGFRVKEKRIKS